MASKKTTYKRELFNQLINFFWTILCFAPVVVFWMHEGTHVSFYLFVVAALFTGLLPQKIMNRLLFSADRKFYEKLGVRHIRKFVQNGDAVKALAGAQDRMIITNHSQTKKYLKTIALYERFHVICFTFFLLTTIHCFFSGSPLLGWLIAAANVVYNLTTLLLQQYNKIRIRKMAG